MLVLLGDNTHLKSIIREVTIQIIRSIERKVFTKKHVYREYIFYISLERTKWTSQWSNHWALRNHASFSCIRSPQVTGWCSWVFNKLSSPCKRGLFHPWPPWVGERIPPPKPQAKLLSPQGRAVHLTRGQLQWEWVQAPPWIAFLPLDI